MRTSRFARNMVKGMTKALPGPGQVRGRGAKPLPRRSLTRACSHEREIFINLMWTPECKPLRHLFLAERAASKIAGCARRHSAARHQLGSV